MSDTWFWNGRAERYARMPVGDPQAFERKIEITRGKLTPASVVLDIGCGTGSLALRLAPSAGHVHGLDASSAMIAIAERKAIAAGIGNVSFHVGAFGEDPGVFPEGSLDVICAYSLLHLVRDRRECLSRMFDLLKPGGCLIASTVCLGESRLPYGLLLRVMHTLRRAPRVCVLSRRTLRDEVEAAGFEAVREPDVGAERTISFLVASKPGEN